MKRGLMISQTGGKGVATVLAFKSYIPLYFLITPQAMRSPELPAGSVFMSSALA